ncbi:MAG: 4Fe-4S dicluster domain-containing protein [Candidatus Hodarchaeota archaeon]
MEIGKSYKASAKSDLPAVESLLKVMLENKMVDKVLGADAPKNITQLKPVTIDSPDGIKDMNINAYIAFNFAKIDSSSKYIHKKMGGALDAKIGAFARPCDIRALVELHKRRQVNFDNLILIGTEEYGQIDAKPLAKYLKDNNIDPAKISNVCLTKDKINMVIDGKGKDFAFDDSIKICHNCSNCARKTAVNADIKASFLTNDIILTPMTQKGLDVLEKSGNLLNLSEVNFDSASILKELEEQGNQRQLKEIEEFKALSPEDKMKELGKCTMCGMCINSCPVCFCVDCVLKKKRKAKEIDKFTYQLTRIAHIADTCVQCGKCESNCPPKLPLNVYFNNIANMLAEKFNYVSGQSFDDIPPRANVQDLELRFKKH